MTSRVSALGEKSLVLLLETYKELPCLWDQRHKDYTNQVERKKAYDIIMKKININEFQIPVAAIKKKLENMRTTYKREHRKVMAAYAKGEETYKPTLWYYDLLGFIDCSDDTTDRSFTDPDNEDSVEYETLEFPEYDEVKDIKPKKRKMDEIYLKDNDVSKNDFQVATTSFNSNDEAIAFGQTLGLQLRDLDGYQRTIAEKLISDIIFYARLNKLNTNSTLELNVEFIPKD